MECAFVHLHLAHTGSEVDYLKSNKLFGKARNPALWNAPQPPWCKRGCGHHASQSGGGSAVCSSVQLMKGIMQAVPALIFLKHYNSAVFRSGLTQTLHL